MSNHRHSRQVLHRLSRRYTFLLSAVVGAMAGGLAVLYKLLVTGLAQAEIFTSGHVPRDWWWLPLCLAPLGGVLGWSACRISRRFCPEAGGSGIPHVKAVLLGLRRIRPAALLGTKLVGGLLALGAGMSLGREGPTVHMGAACAAWLGGRLAVPNRTHKNLVAAGAGAGLAAAFNAPLAGFLFIMEELRREMSRVTYGSALVSSVIAVAVARLLVGQANSFGLSEVAPIPLHQLPVVILVGLLASGLGLVFNRSLLRLLDFRDVRGWPLENWGLGVGVMGMLLLGWCTPLTGGGHLLTHSALSAELHYSPWALALLFVIKLLFTVLSYATGVPGGLFAPLLTLGALVGSFCGQLLFLWMPAYTPRPEILATIGMAGLLTSSVRAPLTGVVLIVEMTGQYNLLYALLLAAWFAYLVAEYFGDEPIYEALLRRDLHHERRLWKDEARAVEVLVEPNSEFEHIPLSRFPRHKDMLVALLERNGHVHIPHGTTMVEAGDMLTLLVGPEMTEHDLNQVLEMARDH
ncbi:MAG: H(+)/Cl(-) exchange transporter ClcA [Candidatus Eremiobacteraeota bacterium]|nr:H(+)/Cl(-) exchange transporter ClcA [Candidatus Eremiobacteraeota bacterium]MCW5870577.1 H(+)/Cl(-) exchange transporter ClcA [Candidatus Eremiobacteraeota bacterium]